MVAWATVGRANHYVTAAAPSHPYLLMPQAYVGLWPHHPPNTRSITLLYPEEVSQNVEDVLFGIHLLKKKCTDEAISAETSICCDELAHFASNLWEKPKRNVI